MQRICKLIVVIFALIAGTASALEEASAQDATTPGGYQHRDRALPFPRGPGAIRRCRARLSRVGVFGEPEPQPRAASGGSGEPLRRLGGSADRRALSPRARQRVRADSLW